MSTSNPAGPRWRALRPAWLVPLVLPLLLTLAVIPLAGSGSRPEPAPPASELTVDAPPAPAAGRAAPVLAPQAPAPRQVAQPVRQAQARRAPAAAVPRRTAVRSTGSPRPAEVPDDAPPEDDDAVDDAVRCVEETAATLGTGGC